MTYTTNNMEFAPASGIQELNLDEIDEADGAMAQWVGRSAFTALVGVGAATLGAAAAVWTVWTAAAADGYYQGKGIGRALWAD